MRVFGRGLALATLLIAALLPATAPARARAADLCFAETGKCIRGQFAAYWSANGGLAQQGFPLTDEFDEANPTDGKVYRTQYFERARFEYHPENQAPYDVLLGLLGREQLQARYGGTPPAGVADNPLGADCVAFAETGKRTCSAFLAYWEAHGGLAQQGLPLTDLFMETNPTDGKQYPTQYFERARFEHHAENLGTPYAVLLGLLGGEQFAARYPYGLPLARDGFSDPSSGWPALALAAGTAGYAGGGYRMMIAQPNSSIIATNRQLQVPGEVVVEVDVRKLDGPDADLFGFGIVCRAQDDRNFYLLEINGGGLYGIVKVRDGRATPLRVSNGMPDPAIRPGNATNRLTARCGGDGLALAVNGTTLAEARDGDFGTGAVGLLAGAYNTPGLVVLFDDLAIYGHP